MEGAEHVETFTDNIIFSVHPGDVGLIESGDPVDRMEMVEKAKRLAMVALAGQGRIGPDGRRVAVRAIDKQSWTFTNKLDEARTWEAHDCDVCREGHARALAVMETQPGTWLAFGTVVYRNVYWEPKPPPKSYVEPKAPPVSDERMS